MDCEQFRNMLDNYENLSREEHLKLAEHTAQCAECRAELDFMDAILKVTKSLPEIKPDDDFIENLNKRIDKENAKRFRFASIDWKRYGSVAACLLFAVVAGINGRMLVSKMNDGGNGVIDETEIISEVGEVPKYTADLPELVDEALPAPVIKIDSAEKASNKTNKSRSDLKDMVIDSSAYVKSTPSATHKPVPTSVPESAKNSSDTVLAPAGVATPDPSDAPYTIEKSRYRIPNENNGDAVVVSENTEPKDDGYSLSKSGESATAMNNRNGSDIVDKEIESAIPASTIVIYSESEARAKELIADYIVGIYGTYYMTTENNLYHLFEAFDFAGIKYEKYIGGSSDKISFRLVVLP